MGPNFPFSTVRRWTATMLVAVPATLLCQTAPPAQFAKSVPEQAIAAQTPVPQLQVSPEELGDAYMAHQRYQAAIEAYKKAPLNTADIWNKLGVAYQLMFNNNDAERCYKKALKLDPKNGNALNNMGSVYMEAKLYGPAERIYRKAVRIDPKSALFHKNLGTAYLAQRHFKQGWAEYEAALAIDPTIFSHTTGMRVQNPASLEDRGAMNFYMARSCAHAGEFEQAVQYLRLALNEGYTNPKKVLADAEFSRMRSVPAFQELMASQGVYLAPLSPPQPIRQ